MTVGVVNLVYLPDLMILSRALPLWWIKMNIYVNQEICLFRSRALIGVFWSRLAQNYVRRGKPASSDYSEWTVYAGS